MSVTRHALGASASGAESLGSTTLSGASIAVATMLSNLSELSDKALLGKFVLLRVIKVASPLHTTILMLIQSASTTLAIGRESLDQKAMRQRMSNLRYVVSDRFKDKVKMPSKKWERKQHTAFLVQVAALCSRAVYRKDPAQVVPELSGYVIKDRHWVEPTWDGSGKAAALFEIAPDTPDFHQKILVIAVRGSASTVDWLVNLNSELTESPGLVKLPDSIRKPVPKVHRGFAQCATALAPGLLHQIKAALEDDDMQGQTVEIVFTGHSAGGAVACLLFCHFLTCHGHVSGSNKPTLSCITFGCPPFINADIDSRLTDLFPGSGFLRGSMLTFVNDGDPIPRMDSAYATELARIWNLVGGSTCPPMSAIPEFKPPKLRLSSLGEVVWLSEKDQEIRRKGNEEENEGLKVAACYLNRNDLEKHAWANVMAHDMNLYVN
ncbi:hypothetical protein CNYM01_05230 [Colletotrichum nymphaeae SA-01]|uniref:Fungal lipase-type domain-containing protein n=1 Tax=Colletotrichum nymphaeae SA-01 TaxID=1460502 RepID=A0A135TSZ9_9PEZI|nr:hypothetical protein CNYM01_05230 [Colletotrichum nymphaeae SA-01]